MKEDGVQIGQLNGKWAALFKVILVLMSIFIPTMMSWAVWVTVTVYDIRIWMGKGGRFTSEDGRLLHYELIMDAAEIMDKKLEQYPPDSLIKQVDGNSDSIRSIDARLDELQKELLKAHQHNP